MDWVWESHPEKVAEKWIAADWGLHIAEAANLIWRLTSPACRGRGLLWQEAACRTPTNWKQPKYPAEGIGLINDGTLIQGFRTAVHICDDRLLTARKFVFGLLFSEKSGFKTACCEPIFVKKKKMYEEFYFILFVYLHDIFFYNEHGEHIIDIVHRQFIERSKQEENGFQVSKTQL